MLGPKWIVLAAGVALAAATMGGAAAQAAPPDILTTFSPGPTTPGTWREGPASEPYAVNTGAGTCAPGGSRTWTRQDGTDFTLNWWTCPGDAARALADEAFATQLRVGNAPGAVSYLGGADAVFRVREAAIRSWVQESYSIQLRTECPTLTFADCAALSGAPARQIAAGLPGKPQVTGLLPPFSAIVSALVTFWLLTVGATMLVRWAIRPRFDAGLTDPRLLPVDRTARALRWRHRGRRAAYVIGLASILPLLGAVLNRQDGVVVFAARLGVFLLMAGVAVALFVVCRHPMLGATIPLWRRIRAARPSPRRLLGSAVLLVLAVILSVAPLAAIVVLMILGLVVQGGGSGMSDADARMMFAAMVVAIAVLGYLLDRAGRRLRMHNAWEAISADPRPRILYLRNFGDDKQKVPASALGRVGVWQLLTGWLNPIRTSRFEEILARALARFGPVIAVDPPGTRFSRLGAAKTLLPADNWLDQVALWADDAQAVVVSAAPDDIRPGLHAELKMLAERLTHGRIVLILGPHRSKALLHAAIGRFLLAVHGYPMFRTLVDRPVADGTLVLLHVPTVGWGHWRGWSARHRTAWTYTAAINEAMSDARDAWAAPVKASDAVTEAVR
ncbi:hypothetical protein V6W11_22490 [Micromonospora profundi]|uniref:hypothetical protein n=1 Tax=Micromonospora profundi TaxID=1420889 RepID=UPI002FF3ED92